jgi:ribosomal protein S18 acetylase RimI-like enzyme
MADRGTTRDTEDRLADLLIREAREDDVADIVELLAADVLGGHGDTSDKSAHPDYLRAFKRIAKSANDTLYVAEFGGEIVGTFQTTLITTMLGRGSSSLKIEAVHVRAGTRGRGVGRAMMRFAVDLAREAGARSVQLTSNKAREDAHHFYQRLGFVESHVGFKMVLR